MALAVIGILVLASFVIAYFSARTWHWGYVILVELIFLATLGFLLLATEVVTINAILRSQVNRNQKDLDTALAQDDALRNGTTNGAIIGQLANRETPVKTTKDDQGNDVIDSLAELDHKLLIATRLRGRVWRNVTPAGQINPQTGALTVNLPAPVPAGIKPDTEVYVFEDGPPQALAATGAPRDPQYLGEFHVAQVGPQQASLQPALPLDELERRRLAASRGPWIIYETMPLDRHEIFAGKTEQELKQLLPAKSVNEYLRQDKPATADDDPLRVIGLDENGNRLPPGDLAKATKKLYQRRLRDYASEFDVLARRRAVMLADIVAVKQDIARLTTAQDIAKNMQAYREDEKQKLTSDLAGITKEKDAIDHHLAQLRQQLARARELTAELQRRNNQMADELAARQLRSRAPGNGATSPAKSAAPLALGRG